MDIVRIKRNKNSLIVTSLYEGLYINSNAFNNEVLYYTKKYLNNNKESIRKLLKSLEINKVIYQDEEAFFSTYGIINSDCVVFDTKESLSIKAMNRLLRSNIKKIECFFMPGDYVHQFSKKNVSIIFKNNLAFTSDFVKYNNLNNLKQVYYKREINFYGRNEIRENIKHFLNVNKYLKVVNLYYYNIDDIRFILELLINKNRNDIRLFIHQNEDNVSLISKDLNILRKLNKNDNYELKVVYDDDFFNKRIFSLLTNNTLKLASIIVVYVGLVLMFSNRFQEYSAALEIRKLEAELNDKAADNDENIVIDEVDDTSINTQTIINEQHIEVKETINYNNIPRAYEKLSRINPDVVGWIRVNNTSINYPVLQAADNNYYLKHDIYGNEMISGWIFMDYRNNSINLNKNTIIYGHAAKSGLMFGTLYKTTYDWWLKNENNHIITFNILDEENSYQIFSIYKIDETTDYLKVNFADNNDFIDFVNMIKKRSLYDFNVNVTEDDKIITLSTCSGTNRRLVIHAKKL